jgi:hypothetical protein
VGRDGSSDAIEALRDDATDFHGYDGQFFLYVALDPGEASAYLDNRTYRLSRLGYPILARAVALGQADLVPAALLLVNLGAIAFGTLALAALLRRRGASSWWAVLFPVYPGIFLAAGHDLAEPLAYALVAGGLYALDRTGVGRPLPAALLFALAGATRETTLVFPAVLAGCVALGLGERGREQPRRGAAILLAGMAFLPYAAVRVALAVIYGTGEEGVVEQVNLVPFANYVSAWSDQPWMTTSLMLSVAVPAVLAIAVVAYGVRAPTPSLALLVANALVVVSIVPTPSLSDYLAAGRIGTGVVVAFIAAVPFVRRSSARRLVWLPIVLWLLPWAFVGEIAKEL